MMVAMRTVSAALAVSQRLVLAPFGHPPSPISHVTEALGASLLHDEDCGLHLRYHVAGMGLTALHEWGLQAGQIKLAK
jgi:hypothetical protein